MEGIHNKNKDGTGLEADAYERELEPDELEDDVKPDKPSTVARKAQFLKLFPKCRLIVMLTCREMKMAQHTFYRWYDEDKDFAKAIDKARVHTNDRVRDLLMHKVTVEKETRAITYYLDRKHPEFKPTSKTEVVTGSRTLEDILKEDEQKINDANTNTARGSGTEGGQASKGSEVSNTEAPKDKGQEGEATAVPLKQDTGVLLEKKNPPQSHSEGKAKGNLEDNRRRPIDRLRTKRN